MVRVGRCEGTKKNRKKTYEIFKVMIIALRAIIIMHACVKNSPLIGGGKKGMECFLGENGEQWVEDKFLCVKRVLIFETRRIA